MIRHRFPAIRSTALASLAIVAIGVAGCGGSSSDDAVKSANEQVASVNQQVASAQAQAQSQADQILSQVQGQVSGAQEQAQSVQDQAQSIQDQVQSQVDDALSQAEEASSQADEAVSSAEDVVADAAETAAEETTAAETSAEATTAEEANGEETAAEEIEVAAGPYEAGGLKAIGDQLADQLGYKPQVLEVVLSADFAQFQVRDKAKPKNVDQYEWRDGVISGPVPVKLSGNGDLGENVFPLFSVNLDAAVKLAKTANGYDIEGSEVSTMIIKRDLPFATGVLWYVNVSGTRESKQLRANAQGKVVKVV